MKSVKELEQGLLSTLKVDEAMRTAAAGLGAINPAYLQPGAEERLRPMSEQQLEGITRKNAEILRGILAELARHDSPEAVKAIRRLFRSDEIPYRLMAMNGLSSMSTPEAARAIAKRTSFWAFGSDGEKALATLLLTGSRACVKCSNLLRPLSTSSGPWAGTVEELSKLKLERDHGFLCQECGAVVCPVCSGAKASELGRARVRLHGMRRAAADDHLSSAA